MESEFLENFDCTYSQCLHHEHSFPCKHRILDTRMSEHRDEGHFVEKPLNILKQEYSSPELAKWLQEEIVDKQVGRDHPQSKGNPDMRLYKVFEANKDIRGLS